MLLPAAPAGPDLPLCPPEPPEPSAVLSHLPPGAPALEGRGRETPAPLAFPGAECRSQGSVHGAGWLAGSPQCLLGSRAGSEPWSPPLARLSGPSSLGGHALDCAAQPLPWTPVLVHCAASSGEITMSFLSGMPTLILPNLGLRLAGSFLIVSREVGFPPRNPVPLGAPQCGIGEPAASPFTSRRLVPDAATAEPGQVKPLPATLQPQQRRRPVCRESALMPHTPH